MANTDNSSIFENTKVSENIRYTEEEQSLIKEFLKLVTDKDLPWQNVSNDETENSNISFLYREEDGIGVSRGITEVECPVEEFWKGYEDWKLVKKFDPMCKDIELVKILNDNTRILYANFIAPTPIWERDFVYKEIRAALDHNGNIVHILNNNNNNNNDNDTDNDNYKKWVNTPNRMAISLAVSLSSIKNEEERSNLKIYDIEEKTDLQRVRGDIKIAGYMLQDIGNNVSKAAYICQLNPKGWIPLWVINYVAPNQAQNIIRVKNFIKKEKLKREGKYDELEKLEKLENSNNNIMGLSNITDYTNQITNTIDSLSSGISSWFSYYTTNPTTTTTTSTSSSSTSTSTSSNNTQS